MNTFVIIDGNAILHRAYHAYPKLTKGDVPVGAVYGFFAMLFKLIDDVRPEFLTVCFDRPKPTFRKMLYAGYQANRPKMADDLSSQISLIHEILEKGKIQIFEVDGYEADDLIGTLANQSQNAKRKSQNLETIIVTGDRDMLQLVNSHVKILMPITGITKTVLFDEKAVEEKYGIKPSQFIDYKALIGDASDGYPGVSGIGPKTAAKLIAEYGNFEQLYTSLNKLPEPIAQKLATDAEQAALAKKLATIVTDCPISLKPDACLLSLFDTVAVQKLFEDLEFHSLLKRFPQYLSDKGKGISDKSFGVAQDKREEISDKKKAEKTEKKKDGEQLGFL